MLDNFLIPKQGMEFLPTKMVGSHFSSSDGDVSLKTIERFSFQVPHFWGLKQHNGVEHSELLKNMITVRGVDINVLGHPLGIIKTVRPNSEHPSIHGLISDHSKSPLPSVIFGSNPATRSYHANKRGGLIIPLRKENLITSILSPFLMSDEKSFFGAGDKRDRILKEVLNNIDAVKGFDSIYKNELKSTLRLFVDDLQPILNEYEETHARYQDIIKRNIYNFEGLDINRLKLPSLKPTHAKEWGRYKIDHQTYLGGENLEEMLSSAHPGTLSEQFACTEVLIKRGIVKSFMISTPNEMGCLLYNCHNKGNFLNSSFNNSKLIKVKDKNCVIQMDSHETGTILTTASAFMYFRSLIPCINNLKVELKNIKLGNNKTLFDKSLIHLSSEFERRPREDESGSDHNNHSHTSSFISGSIKKFQMLGNITVGRGRLGTIGTAAPVTKINRTIAARDVYRSVCNILKIECPLPRTHSLLKWDGDTIVQGFEELKNVRGES